MDPSGVTGRAGPRQFGPTDELPREYREAATRMTRFHANSEVMGAYIERPFIRQAPSPDRTLAVSAQAQDEVGHGQLLYRAAETLGGKTRGGGSRRQADPQRGAGPNSRRFRVRVGREPEKLVSVGLEQIPV